MLRPLILTSGAIIVLSALAAVQGAAAQDATTNAEPDRNRAVFPVDQDAVGQRQALLAGIKPFVDGQPRPPNIVLILADDLG